MKSSNLQGPPAVLICWLGICLAVDGASASPAIRIENLRAGETVDYRLLLVRGTLSGKGGGEVGVSSGSVQKEWPVVRGRFKAMVLLEAGRNEIEFSAAGYASHRLVVNYEPRAAGPFVRMVYVTAADSEGDYQAPPGEPSDIGSAQRRIALAGLLLQTATAELMYEAGYGRKTFRLHCDAAGEVETVVHRTDVSMEKAHGMTGLEIWRKLYHELNQQGDMCRNLAILQMTRYDASEGKAYSHTALGGGSLALFGSGGLHTWPETVDDISGCFEDGRYVADYGLFDDSAFRKTFWANFTTGIGACLHELGHAFGLNHSGDPECVMERGFDRINRLFMVMENGVPFVHERVRWAPESARALAEGAWLN